MPKLTTRWTSALATAFLVLGGYAVYAQQGPGQTAGEKVGRKFDQALQGVKRGAAKLGNEIREGFDSARDKVDSMSTEARIYGRLHWDKDLNESAITLEIRDPDVVVLTGSVPDAAARTKAAKLAAETVGVGSVVNELGIASTTKTTTTTTTTTVPK